jgi:hypothetical protein
MTAWRIVLALRRVIALVVNGADFVVKGAENDAVEVGFSR